MCHQTGKIHTVYPIVSSLKLFSVLPDHLREVFTNHIYLDSIAGVRVYVGVHNTAYTKHETDIGVGVKLQIITVLYNDAYVARTSVAFG